MARKRPRKKNRNRVKSEIPVKQGITIQKKMVLNSHLLICIGITVIYSIIIARFYFSSYYVPDFVLYCSMAAQNLPAKDGFSSLFLAIAHLGSMSPVLTQAISLFCMAFSMFAVSYCFTRLCRNKQAWIVLLSIGFVFSSGCFYYLYGKNFYDFPFSLANLSISLLLLVKILNVEIPNKVLMFAFICSTGLCFSWKPYNIFMVGGLYLLLLCNRTACHKFYCVFVTRSQGEHVLIRWEYIFGGLLSFIFGYALGNYRLLTEPQATLTGLLAYPAQRDFNDFLFGRDLFVWDHVNMLPFTLSTCAVLCTVIILFVLPIIIKQYRYLFLSLFMTAMFYVYISHFSPGYPWHGFCFGVFLMLFLFSILMESEGAAGIGKKLLIGFVTVAVLFQGIQNFFYYIPKQAQWLKSTQTAITVLNRNSSDILRNTTAVSVGLDGTFTVDCAVKRYSYLNHDFAYVLESSDLNGWDQLKHSKNYSSDHPKYTLFIEPEMFEQMKDVVQQPSAQGWKTFYYSRYRIIVFKNS